MKQQPFKKVYYALSYYSNNLSQKVTKYHKGSIELFQINSQMRDIYDYKQDVGILFN